MLRRCLGQQGDVRLAFYSSLMELTESSPSLVPIIFEIVHAHVSISFGGDMSDLHTSINIRVCGL